MDSPRATLEVPGKDVAEIARRAMEWAAPGLGVDVDEVEVEPFTIHPYLRAGTGEVTQWVADVTVTVP